MRKYRACAFMVCFALGLIVANAYIGEVAAEEGVAIVISPQTLALSSVAEWVTVHTNIPVALVDCKTLDLSGVPVSWIKVDACGNLVAKFDADAVKAVVVPGAATLTLSGVADDIFFYASDTIRVKG